MKTARSQAGRFLYLVARDGIVLTGFCRAPVGAQRNLVV